MNGEITLEELEAEAAAIGRALCGKDNCWCRVPHYHHPLPERGRVDAAVTQATITFLPMARPWFWQAREEPPAFEAPATNRRGFVDP